VRSEEEIRKKVQGQGKRLGVQVSDNRCCFICGVDNPIGLKVKPSRDEAAGRAWMTVSIPAEFQGWEGVAHGGIISALLDEVSVYAAFGISRQIVTAELNVRYLKPVPIGREVFVEATVRDRVRRSIMVEATISCDGEVLTRSEARLVVLRTPEKDISTMRGALRGIDTSVPRENDRL
jgi:uncharacterized protein (TIGR00369 family)